MKKRISLICLLAAVLAAVVFCALWQSAAQDRSALRALAQSGAAEAYALMASGNCGKVAVTFPEDA